MLFSPKTMKSVMRGVSTGYKTSQNSSAPKTTYTSTKTKEEWKEEDDRVDPGYYYKKTEPAVKTTVGTTAVRPVQTEGDNIVKAYSDAIDRQERLLRQQQEAKRRQREAAMKNTIEANNARASDSLQEAYVANMLAKRNMPQQLRALGISGGLSESAAMDMNNTYMNNRNKITRARDEANARARFAYEQGVDSDYTDYLTEKYNMEQTMAGKLADSMKSSYSGSGTAATTALLNSLATKGVNKNEIKAYLKANNMWKD